MSLDRGVTLALSLLTAISAEIWLKPDLAARGETPAAFGRRCIPAGCVAPRSNTPDILARRALPSGRIAALGATLDFHHGLRGVGSASTQNDSPALVFTD